MIRYELKCDAEHSFEGWFPSSAAFDAQSASGELSCPSCGSSHVAKALMAPAIAKSRSNPPVDPIVMLRALRHEVEQRCENVGTEFAEEARKIHYGETEARGIYGDATPEEAEALADEGIEIAAIPWISVTEN